MVEAVAPRDRDLGSQIRRALSSVGLNLSEGFASAAGNARLRFEGARGSLYEAQAGLRMAVAWGYLSAQDCAPVLGAIDRLGTLTAAWLAHRKRSPIRCRFTPKDARIQLRRLYVKRH